MPQPAGSQDAEAFVGRSHELAVLSAALHQAAAGDARQAGLGGRPRRLGAESERARLNVTRSVRTGTRCSYSPPSG